MSQDAEPVSSPLKNCPSCHTILVEKAVLCVNCGYNLVTKTHLQRGATYQVLHNEDREQNPYSSTLIEEAPEYDKAYKEFNGLEYLKETLCRTFTYEGRVSRSYWWLMHVAYLIVLSAMENMRELLDLPEYVIIAPLLIMAWLLLVTNIKRWHDQDSSGWWVLINLVPMIGPFYSFMVLGFFKGTEGSNDYGDDPLDPNP
jgi:uncharacterized membrane protein YhaH (DUF805 family)